MTGTLAPVHELIFETASEHYTKSVPMASPGETAGTVRERLHGRHFDSVAEIVVCDPHGRLMGLVNIEDLLASDTATFVDRIMDPSPPTIAPHIDQEIAAWEAIHRGEASLAVVDAERREPRPCVCRRPPGYGRARPVVGADLLCCLLGDRRLRPLLVQPDRSLPSFFATIRCSGTSSAPLSNR
jgi:CBS domain-containing protein